MFFMLSIILRELEKIVEQAYLILEDICKYTSVLKICKLHKSYMRMGRTNPYIGSLETRV